MSQYSSITSKLPVLTIESGNDDVWMGVLESVKRIDSIDYRLHYQWVICLRWGENEAEYHENFDITQSYNHLDDMVAKSKRNTLVEQGCIRAVFTWRRKA